MSAPEGTPRPVCRHRYGTVNLQPAVACQRTHEVKMDPERRGLHVGWTSRGDMIIWDDRGRVLGRHSREELAA